ncbi:hypothetical protein CL614_01285 [archaeon]|nr:hypothetical protein [archaeon]|tara:strand:+ start:498 stop:764 length:267 start_codon:yes stop_codon:yes gene_type:complete
MKLTKSQLQKIIREEIKSLREAKRETLMISKYDQKVVKRILDKLRLKAGQDYDFGVGRGSTFLLDLDNKYFDKALEAFIKADVKVRGS